MNHRLREVMEANGDKIDDLASFLDISYQTLNKKINGHTDFYRLEIAKIKIRYGLTPEQVDYIFFQV